MVRKYCQELCIFEGEMLLKEKLREKQHFELLLIFDKEPAFQRKNRLEVKVQWNICMFS